MSFIEVSLADSQERVDTFALKDLLRVHVYLDPFPERVRVRILDARGNTRFSKYCSGSHQNNFLWRIPKASELGKWSVKAESFDKRLELVSADFNVGQTRLARLPEPLPSEQLFYVSEELLRAVWLAHESTAFLGEAMPTAFLDIDEQQKAFFKGMARILASRSVVSPFVTSHTALAYKLQTREPIAEPEPLIPPPAIPEVIPKVEEPSVAPESAHFPGHSVLVEDYLRQRHLRQISGVGPTYEARLGDIGIKNVFEFLVESDTEKLADAARVRPARVAGWQGAALALLDTFSPEAALRPSEAEIKEGSLVDIAGIGVATANKLNAAGIGSISDLLAATDQIPRLAQQTRLSPKRISKWITLAHAMLGSPGVVPSIQLTTSKKEPTALDLQDLRGVGPATAKKLVNAGITNLEELVACHSALQEAAQKTGLAPSKLSRWIQEASTKLGKEVPAVEIPKELKKPLKKAGLEAVKGIGPATAKKLQSAGIETISQLIESQTSSQTSIKQISIETGISVNRLNQFIKNALLLQK
ncbi:MAG: helix-hairpin-helix domain-containing protein [Candidatus Thorarchaeota archaeon]